MVGSTPRCVLGGCEPSSARTQGAFIADSMGATEDAAMRRFAAAAPPANRTPATSLTARRAGAWNQPISIVAGEPVAHDLHEALALLDARHVRRLLEDDPLRAGDAALERLLQGRCRLVVAARDEQRRHRDLPEPILRLPVADRADDVELAR